MIKAFFIFIAMVVAFMFIPTTEILAQTFKSNQFVTKVGDAPEDKKPKIGGSGTKTPAPPPPANLRDAIYNQFEVEFNGFSQQELLWTWEKFWDIQHTKFFELTKGARINHLPPCTGVGCPSSEAKGCTIYFATYPTQELYNVILIHELGHIIHNCAGDARALATKHNNIYKNGQNPVTGYGVAKSFAPNGSALSCFGYPAWGENYSEMIAYYLNPAAKEQAVRAGSCVNNGVVPFENGRHQDFFNLAQEILGVY